MAEKSKEKVVVAKKVEIPKKAGKKVAEGNFKFNDFGYIVSRQNCEQESYTEEGEEGLDQQWQRRRGGKG